MLRKIFKFLVPLKVRDLIRNLISTIDLIVVKFASKTKFTSALYYLVWSKRFYREFQSVLRGKLNYNQNIKRKHNFEYLLRRNIHRLEKGLIMRPRRDVFAKAYIQETLDAFIGYHKSLTEDGLKNQEYYWYRDVLDEYFNVTGDDPLLNSLREEFFSIYSSKNTPPKVQRSPYHRDLEVKNLVSYEQMLILAKQRRSVRWYESKTVPRELIDKAISVANLSPSACNRQPFEFKIFDDPELLQKVAAIPMGTVGFSDNFPMIIVVVGTLDAYFHERDRHVIYIDGSLASMSFMFALETLGLSSCPINWPDIEHLEGKMQKLLQLEDYERPIMLMSVGYPDKKGMVPFSEKKNLDNIRNYNNTK